MDDKKTLSLDLALLPIVAMLLLLIIGYGQFGLRIEPLLLVSAGIAAALAWWQGYRWDDIIDAIVSKLAKAMPVIMILICVGGLIGTWMISGTIPYMVYWGLKLISPQYILIAAFFITSVISVCTGTSWGAAGTGRCWTRDELTQLMTLCRAHGVTVISDEIWADLLLPGQTFTSVLHLDTDCQEQVIAATAASKTFGLSSLRISNFLIPNARMRGAFIDRLNAHGLDVFNALSMTAATAAYQHGEAWLNDLQRYLAENRRWFEQALSYAAPWCKMTRAEGTYLAWLDCRALGLDDDALQQALIHTSKIAPSMGRSFGSQGKGFIRINLGCPRQYLEDAIRGLAKLTP
ncbi:aminotransferase class I/II-fold pyridoxal phosphate-dependent enzyme [Serratia marcescens]|uniref:aminotransferase class I/II-fold pyridoxal phosphate-dependent enzyme n=1 Tax=Serratia marcescens TaxID=615 RepID=UPI003D6FC922